MPIENEFLRVVMDTNVLYAGLRSKVGSSYLILEAIEQRQILPLLSQTILGEYEEVLKFHAAPLQLSLSDIDAILDYLCSVCEKCEMRGPWTPVLTDPDDEAFVKVAVAGAADCILTHNSRHFAPARTLGIKVLAPREFLAMIKE